ncbi:MAG TPA: alpha-ketoglutarate-dependent dioxygenase AlkB [Acidimicrobiales bacterium]|nr:alpha-ketoglutarate-dependent dioxygenase AlkB [Acidimicrobiales bacterium]
MNLAWQLSLLGAAAPSIDATFRAAYRVELDAESWIDVVPGWLAGADEVFAALAEKAPWSQRQRIMWGNKVPEPRLTSGWAEAKVGVIAPVLVDARAALTRRYGITFNSGWLNLYRDGHDSVAWHRDRIPKSNPFPLVGILSLGSRRRFLVRPYGGGPSVRFDPAPGDLLVTGGLMQRQWEHTVPKVPDAGPRISVTFRHIHDDDQTKMGEWLKK